MEPGPGKVGVVIARAPAARARPARALRGLPAALAVAVVACQIAYPLVDGAARHRLTVATVVVFFTASVTHSAVWRGGGWTLLLLAVVGGGGLAVEAVGVRTGLPFGAYRYTGTLGGQALGVPVVIPLAWVMMGYPALLVARRVTADPRRGPLLAAAALAAWDLFLDPQMVDAGHWAWTGGGPLLGIPLTNFVGWYAVAALMMAVLWPRLPAAAPGADRVPFALYLWTYASSVLAHAAFWGNPEVALVGGVGMGAVVVALLCASASPARA